MDDVNLLPQEGKKGENICKNLPYNFHCSFKGNNKNFRFMSPLKDIKLLFKGILHHIQNQGGGYFKKE